MPTIFYKQKYRYFLLVLLLGAIAGGVFFLISSSKKKKPTEPVSIERQEIINSSRDQGLQKFSLTGFDEGGKTFWNLEGDKAKINLDQTVTLQQNVTLRLKDDTIVKTDYVEWYQNNSLLKTNAPVFVDHRDAKIKGRGAIGRPNDSFIQLNRQIDMMINDKTHVTCRWPMKVYYKEDKIILYRDVKVEDARGVLKARRMDVFFDPVQHKVNQIIAIGDVVIERDSDTTRSERAIYTLATGSIRLEGNPEVTMHNQKGKTFDFPFNKPPVNKKA